jgi:uncharacterized protein (TIGR03067 family)
MRVAPSVFAVLTLVGSAAAQDDLQKAMAQLEGEFTMVSGTASGFAISPEIVKTGKRVCSAGETTITLGGQLLFKARIRIDPTKTPKTIDYDMTEGPTKGKTHLGIYEIEGDMVRFCFAAPGLDRPNDFTAKEGSGQTLSVWKREK